MTKNCTDDYRALDVRSIKRAGRLTPGQSFSWIWTRSGKTIATINMQTDADSVRLNYRKRAHGGEWRDMDYAVRLAYTPCNLGGQRVWWQCPAAGCGRRIAVLYGGSGIFGCRHCYRLAYRSQREAGNYYRPADKLRARLGWVPGIAHPPGDKPKGMHWKTYQRLTSDYYSKASRAMADMSGRISVLKAQLDRIKI